jgi:hypothetical protein
LRNFIEAIWQKQQNHNIGKVGRVADRVRRPSNHGFQGRARRAPLQK